MDAPTPALSADFLLTHAPFVRALARGLLRDEHLVEDVVQETWLRLSKNPPREHAATRSWIGAVVHRLSIDRQRERSRRVARELASARPEALPSVAEELAHAEVLRSVVEAVLALDEPYRTSVLLAYWRGWDARRIAQETRTPLATVRSRLQRSHAKIRERLDHEHGRETWGLALVAMSTRELGAGLTSVALGSGAKLALGATVLVGTVAWLWQSQGDPVRPPAAPAAASPIALSWSDEGAGASTANERATAPSAAVADATAQVIRIAGTITDLACAELALAEGPAADLALRAALAQEEWGFGEPLATAELRTDAAGRFAFELADPGTRPLFVRLSADQDQHYRFLRYAREIEGDPIAVDLSRAAHGVLHGSVIDDRGQPLAGVLLRFAALEGDRAITSTADGSFSVEGMRRIHRLEAQLAGYSLLDWDGAVPLEAGGWTATRVRMGPEAALRLQVLDPGGKGIPEVRIQVGLDASERAALEMDGNASDASRAATTDEGGIATLEGLWAGRKLRVVLTIGNQVFPCHAMASGELVLSSERTSGGPIVLSSGRMHELVARLAIEREIAGRVVLAGGGGVPGARVIVSDLGRGSSPWDPPEVLRLVTDREGSFSGIIRTAELRGPLRIEADVPAEGDHGRLAGLGYAGPAAPGSGTSAASGKTSLPADDPEALRAIEIVVEPSLSISGTLRDPEGKPLARVGFGQRIWAAAADGRFHGAPDRTGTLGEDGTFLIASLPPGTYDICVSEELESFYSFTNFVHRFPSIAAGSREVELRIPEREEARIRIRMLGGGARAGVLLHRKLFPEDRESLLAPSAGAVTRVSGAMGWPEGTSYDFTGIGGSASPAGTCMDGYDSLEGSEQALVPLEPGWYAIGVHPRGSEGEGQWFPQATPILYFGPGEHVVDFELWPAVTLRGRVLGDAEGEFLAVTLVDERGASVMVASIGGFTEPARIHDTSASGEFVLRYVPTGQLRLRAGSRTELERGAFRREVPIEIRPGEDARIEIQL